MARRRAAAADRSTPDPLHVGRLHLVLLRLLMVLCWLLAAVAWLTALTAAPILPTDSGATSYAGVLYGVPLLTVAVALAMVLLYQHPRYAAMPGTLLLDLLPARERSAFTEIVRANLVPGLTLVNLMLAYLHSSLISVALGNRDQLDPLPLVALAVLFLLSGAVYSVVSARLIDRIVRGVRRS